MKPPRPVCVDGGQWLTEVDIDHPRLAEARALCMSCPALVWCRDYSLETTDVDGVAAGMTRYEREAWRKRHTVRGGGINLLDVTPAWEITPEIAAELPVQASEIHSTVRAVIKRMTNVGMSAELISQRLAHPQIKPETVDFVRRTYFTGHARVENT